MFSVLYQAIAGAIFPHQEKQGIWIRFSSGLNIFSYFRLFRIFRRGFYSIRTWQNVKGHQTSVHESRDRPLPSHRCTLFSVCLSLSLSLVKGHRQLMREATPLVTSTLYSSLSLSLSLCFSPTPSPPTPPPLPNFARMYTSSILGSHSYADVCLRMLAYADVCVRMLTYADVC